MGYRAGTGYELYEHRSLVRPHIFCDGCGRVQRTAVGWATRSYPTYGHDNYGREVTGTRRHDLCAQCREEKR